MRRTNDFAIAIYDWIRKNNTLEELVTKDRRKRY